MNGSTRTASSLEVSNVEGILVRPNGKRSILGLPSEVWLHGNRLSLVWKLTKKKDIAALQSHFTKLITIMGSGTIEKPVGDTHGPMAGDVYSVVQTIDIVFP